MMSSHDTLRQTLTHLRSPINDQEVLLQTLSNSLKMLGVHPESAASSFGEPLSYKSPLRFIPEYQITLLEHVVPHWMEQIQESGNLNLLTDYFIPTRRKESGLSNEAPRMESILSAYSVLTSHAISQFSVDVLARLFTEVTTLDVFQYLLERMTGRSYLVEASQRWSDYLKAMFSVPGKASNAIESGKVVVPAELGTGSFLANACQSWTSLLCHPSYKYDNGTQREAASLFLGQLVALGCFPIQPPSLPSSPSFWNIALPNMRQKVVHAVSAQSDPSPEGSMESHSTKSDFNIKLSLAMASLPISQQLSIVASLLFHLDLTKDIHNMPGSLTLEAEVEARGAVKRESLILLGTLGDFMGNIESGKPDGDEQEVVDNQLSTWPLVSNCLEKRFSEGIARVIVCWAAQSEQSERALEILLNRSLELWADEEHIRHSTLQRHRSVTCLLLATIQQLASVPLGHESKKGSEARIKHLATNSIFIRAVGVYIEHSEPCVRRCGMLTAEIVATIVGSKLHFPGWEDDGDGQEWARRIRTLLQANDVDAAVISSSDFAVISMTEVDESSRLDVGPRPGATAVPSRLPPSRVTILEEEADSDDSLEGYVSESPSSSRASSPLPPSNVDAKSTSSAKASSGLRPTIEEINADPTLLNPLQKRIQKPVYLLDLGKLLKVGKEGNKQYESIQVALNTATSLIRKKAGWGLELDENAVDLTHSLIGLQNNYELEEFDHRVLEALTALVACAPRKVAMCIIEHFFTPSYSTSHRFTMLNALALGARELAGLPTPQISLPKASFPSRLLPASTHRRYYTVEDESDAGAQVRGLVESISTKAIAKGREDAEERVPEIVRERQLTVRLNRGGRAGGIVELQSKPAHIHAAPNTRGLNKFNEIAAEYFILPLVSKFWEYLQDTLAREERSMRTSRTGEGGFRAAGTAMILSPLVLSHFVNTTSIMAHASRHSPAFLAVIAPAILELAVTLGTRKMSSEPQLNSSLAASASSEDSKRSASILSASLELAIVILDASIDLDSGKTLALEHGSLVSGTVIWAQKAFSMLDSGLQLEGMGGQEEDRLRRASAGLVLKLEEITRKWSQAMLLPF